MNTKGAIEPGAAPRIHLPLPFAREALQEVCERYQVRELSLFGSSITRQPRPTSDVDLLVEFQPAARIGFLALARLQRELTALFQRNVDLVPAAGLKPLIRDSVQKNREILYEA